ncbi:histone lysine set [Cystoisospora suis]|uniref:Histone lysine set n=1 Tax=Cystoisospora suis TaxID=483139 RepID=A0A2C6L766_9APIC|nr:histone lysine set [Cystoisospora suis]
MDGSPESLEGEEEKKKAKDAVYENLSKSVELINSYSREHHDGILHCEIHPDKGRILRATQDFTAGSCLLKEPPLHAVQADPDNPLYVTLTELCSLHSFQLEPIWYWCAVNSVIVDTHSPFVAGLTSISPKQYDLLRILHVPSEITPCEEIERIFTEFSLESHTTVQDLELMLQIWIHNCFEQHDDPIGYVIYFMPSFSSHSCLPNTLWFTDEKDRFVLRSRAHLKKGDEVTLSYLSEEDLMRPAKERRKVLLETKDFFCACERCSATVDFSRGFRCPFCDAGCIYVEPGACIAEEEIGEFFSRPSLTVESVFFRSHPSRTKEIQTRKKKKKKKATLMYTHLRDLLLLQDQSSETRERSSSPSCRQPLHHPRRTHPSHDESEKTTEKEEEKKKELDSTEATTEDLLKHAYDKVIRVLSDTTSMTMMIPPGEFFSRFLVAIRDQYQTVEGEEEEGRGRREQGGGVRGGIPLTIWMQLSSSYLYHLYAEEKLNRSRVFYSGRDEEEEGRKEEEEERERQSLLSFDGRRRHVSIDTAAKHSGHRPPTRMIKKKGEEDEENKKEMEEEEQKAYGSLSCHKKDHVEESRADEGVDLHGNERSPAGDLPNFFAMDSSTLGYQKNHGDLVEMELKELLLNSDVITRVLKNAQPGVCTLCRQHWGDEDRRRALVLEALVDQYGNPQDKSSSSSLQSSSATSRTSESGCYAEKEEVTRQGEVDEEDLRDRPEEEDEEEDVPLGEVIDGEENEEEKERRKKKKKEKTRRRDVSHKQEEEEEEEEGDKSSNEQQNTEASVEEKSQENDKRRKKKKKGGNSTDKSEKDRKDSSISSHSSGDLSCPSIGSEHTPAFGSYTTDEETREESGGEFMKEERAGDETFSENGEEMDFRQFYSREFKKKHVSIIKELLQQLRWDDKKCSSPYRLFLLEALLLDVFHTHWHLLCWYKSRFSNHLNEIGSVEMYFYQDKIIFYQRNLYPGLTASLGWSLESLGDTLLQTYIPPTDQEHSLSFREKVQLKLRNQHIYVIFLEATFILANLFGFEQQYAKESYAKLRGLFVELPLQQPHRDLQDAEASIFLSAITPEAISTRLIPYSGLDSTVLFLSQKDRRKCFIEDRRDFD